MSDTTFARYYPGTEIVYPAGASVIRIDEITFGERGRKDYGNVEQLAETIKTVGLIQPIVINQNHELVAGGRRIKAHQHLGLEHVAYVYRETLTESQLVELELIENLERKQTDWHEDCVLIAKTHRLKRKEAQEGQLDPRALAIKEEAGVRMWGQRETGRLMKVAFGQVSMAIKVAEYIEAGDEEVMAAPNIKAALDVLVRRREAELNAKLAEDDQTKNEVPNTPPPTSGEAPSSSTSGGAGKLGGGVFDILLDPEQDAPSDDDKRTTPKVKLSESFILGDAKVVLPKMPAESVDHIITDPPYGIDMSNLEENIGVDADIKETHEVEKSLELNKFLLTEGFRLVKDKGFMFVWCDPIFFNRLRLMAEAVGWRPQRWPIVWHKLSPCKNQAPHQNTTKDIEFCLKLRKGSASLTNPVSSSVITADNPDAKLYDNPFAKPFEVWKRLIDMSALRGQTILDPCGGNFSMARAAINLGMNPISVEVSEQFFNKGLADIKQFYRELHRGEVLFT